MNATQKDEVCLASTCAAGTMKIETAASAMSSRNDQLRSFREGGGGHWASLANTGLASQQAAVVGAICAPALLSSGLSKSLGGDTGLAAFNASYNLKSTVLPANAINHFLETEGAIMAAFGSGAGYDQLGELGAKHRPQLPSSFWSANETSIRSLTRQIETNLKRDPDRLIAKAEALIDQIEIENSDERREIDLELAEEALSLAHEITDALDVSSDEAPGEGLNSLRPQSRAGEAARNIALNLVASFIFMIAAYFLPGNGLRKTEEFIADATGQNTISLKKLHRVVDEADPRQRARTYAHEEVSVFEDTNTESQQLGSLFPGEQVFVLWTKDDWNHIQFNTTNGSNTGWIKRIHLYRE